MSISKIPPGYGANKPPGVEAFLELFDHIERYGMLNRFLSGDMSQIEITQLSERFKVPRKLLWKLLCFGLKEWKIR